MRVSIRCSSRKLKRAFRLGVSLNGQKLTHCVAADSRQGWVLVYREGPDGRFIFNHETATCEMQKLHGVVRIEGAR